MKKWKGKNEKSEKLETVGAVTHTHTHKDNLKDTVGAQFREIPNRHDTTVPFKDNSANGNNKRTYKYMPLIVVLMLICVISLITIGINTTNKENKQIAEIETKAKEIHDYTITNGVSGSQDISTGEVRVHNSSGSDILYNEWRRFLATLNWDNIKSFTFTGRYGIFDEADAFKDMGTLTTINGLDLLLVNSDGVFKEMFKNCRNLKEVDLSAINLSSNFDGGSQAGCFFGCDSLTDVYTPTSGRWNAVDLPNGGWYNVDDENDNNIYTSFGRGTFLDKGSVHLRKLVNYDIEYNLDGGSVEGNPDTYNALSGNISLKDPTKEGYTFIGWTGSNGTTPETTVTIKCRETTGDLSYKANYSVNSYTLTIAPNGGSTTDELSHTIEYGSTKTIANPTKTGYNFVRWDVEGEGSSISGNTFTMGSEDAKITAVWEAADVEYKVKHYTQNLDETYSLADTETHTAKTDSNTAGPRKEYTGFNTPEEKSATIAADGSTVIEYYYTRKSYTVSLTSGTGISGTSGGGRYTYGADVEVSATLKENTTQYTYGWSKWTGSGVNESSSQTYKFTMPASDVSLTANGTETVNTYRQIIQVRYENGDGTFTGYSNVINKNYKYGETVSWSRAQDETYEAGSITSYEVAGPQATPVQVTIKRRKYQLTLEAGRGIANVEGSNTYRVGQSVTITATPARGYDFKNWTGTGVNGSSNNPYTFNMPTTAVRLTANSSPRNDTPYTVKHWKQTISASADERDEENEYNYTEVEEDRITTLVGTTDSQGGGQVNEYEGFTSPVAKTVTIKGDGTSVLNYYYTRNRYTLKLKEGKGISAAMATGMEEEGEKEYPYEQRVTINARIYVGYVWDKWTGTGLKNEDGSEKTEISDIKYEFNMPSNNVEYEAKATPNPDTAYTIKHWKQKLDGTATDYTENSYECELVEVLHGETDSRVSPETKDYEGFKKPDAEGISVPITGEGTLIVDYFYKRNYYNVVLNKGVGIKDIIVTGNVSGEGKDKYLYEEDVTIEAILEPGYTWSGWNIGANGENDITVSGIEHSFTIGLEDIEYTANAIPNEDTPYKVQHWQQNIPTENNNKNENTNPDDVGAHSVRPQTENYTLIETEEKTGTTDTEITPETKEYIGFTAPEKETVIILGDGSQVINYYYTRNLDTPYTVKHWQQTVEAAIRDNSNNQEETTFEEIELINLAEIDITEPREENNELSEDGNYVLVNTENKTGMTGASITPEVKEYIGFISPNAEQVEILADGSLEVNYYYNRKTDIPYIVQHWKENLPIENNDETVENNVDNENYTLTDTDNLTGITGRAIMPTTKEYIGFTAPTPEEVEIKADGSLIVNYYYTRNTDTPYKIHHWTQNLEGNVNLKDEQNYTIRETETLGGLTEATITAETKEYEGFIAPEKEELTIAADGSSELNYYYTRRKDLNGQIKHIDKETEKTIFKRTLKNQIYESEIDIREEIMDIEDYNFDSMEPETLKIGTGENIANIYYVKKEGKVIVHHYIYDEKTDTNTTEKIDEDQEIIGKIGDDYRTKKSENIPENYIIVDETPEDYIGRIEGETKEITYYYKLKAPKVDSEVGGGVISGGEQTEDGKWKIKAGEEIKYEIKYNTQIEEYKGKVKIEVKAELPRGTRIDKEKCNFAEGTYDETTHTVNWTKEIENINTFQDGAYTDGINKEITIVYAEDYIVDEIAPKVIGKTILYYPDGYPGQGGTEGGEQPPLVENEEDGTGKIIVHHYIYNAEENKYTTKRIVADEEIRDKIGKRYTTVPSIEIPINYICINEEPEGYEGTIEKGTKEINYYYKLKPSEVEENGESNIISGITKDEEGNWIIKAGEKVKYEIRYEAKIKNYKGKVKIEVKAELPEGTEIEKERSDLAGGTYEEETNTIKWIKEIEEINTFAHKQDNNPTDVGAAKHENFAGQNSLTEARPQEEGTYSNGIYINETKKEITIIYAQDYVLKDANLKVDGKVKLYYPENDPDKGGQEIEGGGKIITHHYIYKKETEEYTETKIAPDEETTKEIGSEYITKPSSKIPENYECINEKPEGYKGTVEKGTKEINYYYKIKQPTIDTSTGGETIEGGEQTEDGKWQITAGEEVKYKIKYKTEIEDYKGRATVEIKAILPEGTRIDEERSNLAGGTYNEETNTINWTKEIPEIDTFAHKEDTNPDTVPSENGTYEKENYIDGIYTLEIVKEITIVYAEDYIVDEITPKVEGKTTLYYPDGYPGEGGEQPPLVEDETDGRGKIIVHHYIYDEKTNTYTKEKLVEDEQTKGEIGSEYQTKPSERIPANYECINEEPEGYRGIYTQETIKINYYYKLKTPKTDSEVDSEVISGGTQDKDGNWVIKAGEEIKYRVRYKTTIEDYKGKADIEVKAELPEGTKINLAKCRLQGGTYNEETNIITWIKEIAEINTFAHKENKTNVGAPFAGIPARHDTTVPNEFGTYSNGIYTDGIIKEITIVYAEDYVLEDMGLKVTGKTKLYYPENYPIGDGNNNSFIEEETEMGGKITVHHYIYDEKANNYTTIKLTPDEKVKGKIGAEYQTKPSEKVPENYECINDKPEGHTGTITKEAKEISYYYKLKTPKTESELDSDIIGGGEKDEEGNWIIKAGEEIKYEIKYKTTIEDYIGKAKVEITAELPEGTEIDETKCNLDGGTYDETTNTITWTKEIENIDTFAHKENTVGAPFAGIPVRDDTTVPNEFGTYSNGIYTDGINKEITIVYAKDYVLKDANLKVEGKTILYYPEGHPGGGDGDGNGTLVEDKTEGKGKIIIHHYIYDEEDDKYTKVKLVEDEEIKDTIGNEYNTKPSEKIPSNYECINDKPEEYKGTITKETKEISYYYKLIKTKVEGNGNSNITGGGTKDEEGNWVIKAGEEIKYEINYEVKIEDYKGKAKVEITAELPKGTEIDETKSNLDGGTYNKETNTIKWTKEIENIDTFANGTYEETITKKITIVYAKDYILKDANLKITGKITTYYPDGYPDKGGQEKPSDEQYNDPEENPGNNPDDNPNEKPEEKIGKIIIKYVDQETNEEIKNITKPEEGTYGYEIRDTIGKAYETEEKEIPYYILVRVEGRTKGEIKEETEEVTYYYRKQNFNIGIDKTIETINVNGKNAKISNNKAAKLELNKKDIANTEIIVKYQIKVTNTGELGGTSRILELIPEGYELAYLPEYWKVNRDGSLETKVELEAGQSRELEVVLRWENEENNLGIKTNIAKIEETRNEANFRDTNEEDNIGEATIVISIKTGEVVSIIVIMMIITALGISGYITLYATRRKEPEIKDIKFLK